MFPKYPTLCLDIVSCNYIATVNIRRTLPRVEDVGLHYPHATNGLLCFSQIATENKTNKSWSINTANVVWCFARHVHRSESFSDTNLFLLGCIWPKVLGWFWLWAIGYLVVLLDRWCWLWPIVVGCCGWLDLWMFRWLFVVVVVVRPQCPPSVLPPLSLSKTALVKFKHPAVEAANFCYAIKF